MNLFDRGLFRRVHSGQLERWLGKDAVERTSKAMANGGGVGSHWYGPPIALAGVPGRVFATGDGDFVGRLSVGKFASALDYAESVGRRVARAARKVAREQASTVNSGFPNGLTDLISAASTSGRTRLHVFQKVGVTGVVGATNTLWNVGNTPAAGANGSAAPGGRAPTSSTTGAMPFANPAGGTTQHIVRAEIISSVVNNTLMLCDRLFDVAKTMNSTGTEAVSGSLSRYTNTTAGTVDSAEGNFLFMECVTALAATSHNWTVCLYTNQAGTTSQTLPSVTGNASNIINRLDMPVGSWFAPLATGDTGISALTQMQCSALVATGAINFVIAHPLAVVPCPIANQACTYDGVTTALSLVRVFDNACLSLLELCKPATTATTYSGHFATVAN